jgi:hypothetical protein
VLTGGGASRFSGTFAGQALSGKYSAADVAVTKKLCPKASATNYGMGATFTGTYDGSKYVLHACVSNVRVKNGKTDSFKIVGEVGSTAVSGQATVLLDCAAGICYGPNTSTAGDFLGKYGAQGITGTATIRPQGYGYVITATMTIG